MTRTFLVTLQDVSGEDVDNIAADIQESLQLDGFQVETVRPWASPTEAASSPPISTAFSGLTNMSNFVA